MEYNLNKIIGIKCYEKREYIWYEVLEKGTFWWRFLGIIPIFKYTREEDLYRYSYVMSDEWLPKDEFMKTFTDQFNDEHYVENGRIYIKPTVAIWLTGDSNVGSCNCASILKHFESVESMRAYKDQLITDCASKGIYLREL